MWNNDMPCHSRRWLENMRSGKVARYPLDGEGDEVYTVLRLARDLALYLI